MPPPVRLLPAEIAAIKRIVAAHFGPAAELRVFGSRADPAARGGDLDLHVTVDTPPAPDAEARAGAAIEAALDDRHTDLLVMPRAAPPRRIDEIALATGVLL